CCYLNFIIDLPIEVKRLLSETCMVILYECIEFILGRKTDEVQVYFEHDKPRNLENYKNVFEAPIIFSFNQTGMRIPKNICLIENPSANKIIYNHAIDQCGKLIKQLGSTTTSYTYMMQKIILSNPSKQISEEFIASELFISKRTLARKLKNEGTSYKIVLDDMLSKQAIEYLKETDLSITAIATILNYHDSANFRRAFKRWFKITPREYRRTISNNKSTN
ncbi:AraC family transcriptional regulator, partial [Acinetobacter sp. Ver3]|uniref:AraC family transcriptional regulator n=1 Tax=Acinetobacter sp. Ver3 TaxID=466088 RepID=UPI0004539C10